MTDEELDAQFSDEVEVALDPMGAWRLITSLRTQIAAAHARADRAEAERAAQIEADAKTCDRIAGNTKDFYAETRRAAGMCASAIRAQPHDRTAIDRMLAEAREKALREAVEAYPKGIGAILALIDSHEPR